MKEIEFNFMVSSRYEYYVTKEGRVFKKDTRNGKLKECYYHIAKGYKRIRVTDIKTKIRRYIRVHRLVAMYYIENPKPNEYNIVNHIDGDKLNNHYTNLEWCNISINTQHAYNNGLIKDRGDGLALHIKQDIIKIRKLIFNNKRQDNTEGNNI